MQVNGINNNQTTFGMAFRMTEGAEKVIRRAANGDMNKLAKFGILRNTFGPMEETLQISRVNKGIGKLFRRLNVKLTTGMGEGKTVVSANKLLTNPAAVMAKADGKIASELVNGKIAETYDNILTKVFG